MYTGATPWPLLFGAVLDNACLVWQENCGEKGSCWIYDNVKMGQGIFIIVLVCKFIAFVALAIATRLYKPPKH